MTAPESGPLAARDGTDGGADPAVLAAPGPAGAAPGPAPGLPGPVRVASGAVGLREVLAVREFRALLGSSALSLMGDQIARIAVAVLVFERTGSAFAAASTVACSYLPYLLGGPLLATLADRVPRRRLMVVCDLLRAALVGLLVLPDVPLAVLFPVLVMVGLLSPPFDAAKSATLPEVLHGERYVVGNALQGTVNQAGQMLGFLAGGTVVAMTGAHGALAVDAATYLLSALVLAARVHERPVPPARGTSLLADTRDGFGLVSHDPVLRRLLAFGLLASLVMIAPEGLAVPTADSLGGGAATAGLLTAAVPAGFLLGSFLLLRIHPQRRVGLLPVLLVVSGVVLMLTPLVHHTAAVTALWVVAGAGSALSVVANGAYMTAVPSELRGRAYGVASTALMATQGGLLLGLGALAEVLGALATVATAGAVALLGVLPLVTRDERGRAAVAAPRGAR